ncbi:DUF177 domain-containing protein [Arsenicitalea aurantiaca]|uniref:DUF177 domain-containing protein n=1 Tax=Arsenicitalea aurantiaca TaxID=1783274 RepID=A0A433XEK4_9HYPH|nr:DUF177 domain-containing protein [Arsenicitalea aurantiaca]RUT32547.1 DUF177 domain-containing protein [Arsenicitalea aurantiaca]
MSEPATPVHFADATLRIDRMPADGREIALSPDAEEREALAAQLKITAVPRLEAKLRATRFRGGIRVLGRLRAEIVQPCVVTLEPVTQAIDETVDRVFLPGTERSLADQADAEIFVDLEGEDVPDHFDGSTVDLSELLIETLSLAIDPYPRAPGAKIEAKGLDVDDEALSPFAGLKALKKDSDAS